MELYRPEDVSKAQVSISTFEPGSSRWEAYSNSSLHSSRSSLDSSRSQDPVPPDPALPRGPPETDQSIVPQLLIDHYVSMIDPSRAQTVDNDIARHCAFSLPAVALTLGRTNWPLLKETYESLANDMQWKVRRTLASSIHELGVILGEDVASTDLVPIFNGFIKDLDEVRIGVLKHLAEFLKLLGEEERNSYLPRLEEFLKMDNERNWRFRLELTEQLGILVPIFSADQLTEHLAPIAVTLVQDKVAAVRKAATQVLSVMLGSLQSAGELELCRSTVASLVSCLATSSHWTRRQTYAQLVGQLLTALPWQEVSTHLLPHLLNLTEDRVPNVRLQVANVIGHVLSEGSNLIFSHHTILMDYTMITFDSTSFRMVRRHELPRTREVDIKSDVVGRGQGPRRTGGRLQWRESRTQSSASTASSSRPRCLERGKCLGAALHGPDQPRGAASHMGTDCRSHPGENLENTPRHFSFRNL